MILRRIGLDRGDLTVFSYTSLNTANRHAPWAQVSDGAVQTRKGWPPPNHTLPVPVRQVE